MNFVIDTAFDNYWKLLIMHFISALSKIASKKKRVSHSYKAGSTAWRRRRMRDFMK